MINTSKKSALIFMIMFIISCEEKPTIPILSTNVAIEITTTSATSGGSITNNGGASIIAKGICWNTTEDPTIDNNKTIETVESNSFISHLTGLTPKTTYYARAYATNTAGTGYGESLSFTTLGDTPVSTANSASNIAVDSAILNGSVNPNSLITIISFEWGTTTNYGNNITPNQSPANGDASINVSVKLTSLSPGTTYHFRVRADNSLGTTYSSDKSFKTLGDIPSISLTSATNVTLNSSNLNCSVNPNYLSTIVLFEWGTSTNYGNVLTSHNVGSGNSSLNITENLSGLVPGTTYHFRIKAKNELGTKYSEDFTFTTFAVIDADNNYYHSITIGTQTWMKENLKTTKFNDNTYIQNVTDNIQWSNLTTPAYSWNNNDISNKNTYGALYNWFAVETGKLCPTGWHVPNNSEWTTLINILGGISIAGGKLKESNLTHWQSPNTNATNESGFTGLPGGNRDLRGPFYNLGERGYWWSTETASTTNAWYFHLAYNTSDAILIDYGKTMGFSIRCVKGH